ncbi:MAG TPA: 3-hydroxyacyl-CoA dehydrogenase NAD-binding domain-containing protein [Acetobacteraceae bacterium]|nr:3-hydroxyacyl-CoA dehydrogenase NAD-binding domain-containing protein [Acetobacteraceae bacterium]
MPDTPLVRLQRHGPIGVITVDNPPVNALSPGVPEGIIACLAEANADPAITAMVLIGGGRTFIAGADIRQFGKTRVRPPTGSRSYDLLDRSAKPVVAAIRGFALGGGLENALGCHYRIATRSAKLGLPEVLIGILPGGGGTQRLPRLIGPKAALEMIVSGRHLPADEAHALGILDAVIDDSADLLAEAIAFATRIAAIRPLPRISADDSKLAEAKTDPGMFDAMRQKIARRARNQKAPYNCILAVEAACTLPFAEGLARESALFQELENAPEAQALRYAFFAERQAARVPYVTKQTPIRSVATAAVVGAGTMGGGIAMCFADAGIPVRILEASPEAMARGMARIRANYATSVQRGSLKPDDMQARLARITAADSYAAIADADVVIEAIFEEMAPKKQVFAQLDAAMKPGALLLSNTSALDIDEIATATTRPADVAGAHFFSPANVMKLLEVVRGAQTSPETIASVMQLGRQLAKVAVACGNCDGFVANRSRAPFSAEMSILLEEGALPEQVDAVMLEFGYPMGPFAVGDLAGLDIGAAGRRRRAAADPNYRKQPIADRLVEMGRFGQKTGAGWYRYDTGDRTPHPDPVVAGVIREIAASLGNPPRSFTDTEILHRLLFASVNEACKILEEGIAHRASDIDIMWLYGFGFPRYRGGLMFWADSIGPRAVYDQIAAWHQHYGARWAPSALLRRLADGGTAFRDAS